MPHANAHVERFHRYMNAALTIMGNRRKTDWDFFLPAALFAYRISIHDSTGVSPFMMVYGRRPGTPMDLFHAHRHKHEGVERDGYYKSVADAMKTMYEEVRQEQRTLGDKRLAKRNKSQIDVTFEDGDMILLWEQGTNNGRFKLPGKLQDRYSGPHQVVGTCGTRVNYYIMNKGVKQKVHVNRMLRFQPWSNDDLDTAPMQGTYVSPPMYDEFRSKEGDNGEEGLLEVEVGDMVIVPNDVDDEPAFDLAKIMTKSKNGDLKLHWYGTNGSTVFGTYHPGWTNTVGKKPYYDETRHKKSDKPFTNLSVSSKCPITAWNIVFAGFSLLPNGRLPRTLLESISNSEWIQWEAPNEDQDEE